MGQRIKIETHGGGYHYGVKQAQHWVLFFDGEFLSKTSVPEVAAKFEELAELVNGKPED